MGASAAVLGQYHLLSAKMSHPMRFSLQGGLKLTLQWSVLKHVYSFTVILCKCCQCFIWTKGLPNLSKSTGVWYNEPQFLVSQRNPYHCLSNVSSFLHIFKSFTQILQIQFCLICIVCTNSRGKTIRKKRMLPDFKYYILYYVDIQSVFWNP